MRLSQVNFIRAVPNRNRQHRQARLKQSGSRPSLYDVICRDSIIPTKHEPLAKRKLPSERRKAQAQPDSRQTAGRDVEEKERMGAGGGRMWLVRGRTKTSAWPRSQNTELKDDENTRGTAHSVSVEAFVALGLTFVL